MRLGRSKEDAENERIEMAHNLMIEQLDAEDAEKAVYACGYLYV